MDAGFLNFHGGEHFSTLDPSYFLESHAPDEGSSYDGENGYTWDWENEREVELNGDIGLIPVASDAAGDYCVMSTSPPSKEDFHKIMLEWQQLVNIETENVEELPPDVISNSALNTADEAQDVIEYKHKTSLFTNTNINLCDTTNNLTISDGDNAASAPISSITNIDTFPHQLKVESPLPIDEDIIENTVSEENLPAILASPADVFSHLDDPIEHLANSDFDITKYVNETDKPILPSGPGPGGKRLDLKNQRYVVDSEDEDDNSDGEDRHIDVETLSEANGSSVDLDEAEELNEIKSDLVAIQKKIIKTEPDYEIQPEIVFDNGLDLPYDIIEDNRGKTMGLETKIDDMIKELDMQNANLGVDDTQSMKVENILDIEVQKIGVETSSKEEVSPAIEAGDLNSLLEQFEASQTNDAKGDIGKKDHVKSKQILESLPEELINRIKQSSKRKSISVIPPIPNKKRSKPVISSSTIVPSPPSSSSSSNNNNNSESVQMDHDYCMSSSNISSSSSTCSKKDSGFSSCEEDDRSVLRNQPTVKTADGKLMVSLLKVNTIKKRKLNLEEYKQRRQGRSCSGSPARVEDENARRLQRMNTQPCPPPNMEVKTLVSIGVNTDQSWGRLQEIVRGCPSNFSANSLITSLVEHLPQIKDASVDGEHGEDKTIVFLDKNRAPVKTSNKYVQTATNRRDSSSSSSSGSSRSPSPVARKRNTDSEKVREVEERRVIYVGRIANSVTRECLRKRFQRFGPITNVSVHFRRTGDNYGFVTFKYKEDAYEAVEHGNEDPNLPRYDLSFGGRRIFCQTNYADLDNLRDDFCYTGLPLNSYNREDSFEELLRETQAKLLRNKRLNNKS